MLDVECPKPLRRGWRLGSRLQTGEISTPSGFYRQRQRPAKYFTLWGRSVGMLPP